MASSLPRKHTWFISLITTLKSLLQRERGCSLIPCAVCVGVGGPGVCHNVPVSEIIAVREEEGENRGDGSWKKIKEREGKDCGQAFTGKDCKNICSVSAAQFKIVRASGFNRRADSPLQPSFPKTMIIFQPNAVSTHHFDLPSSVVCGEVSAPPLAVRGGHLRLSRRGSASAVGQQHQRAAYSYQYDQHTCTCRARDRCKITEFFLFPSASRPKRLLVYINPYGGKRKGKHIYELKVAPLFAQAGIRTHVIGSCCLNHFLCVCVCCHMVAALINSFMSSLLS